jgi:hypothetical protein
MAGRRVVALNGTRRPAGFSLSGLSARALLRLSASWSCTPLFDPLSQRIGRRVGERATLTRASNPEFRREFGRNVEREPFPRRLLPT